MFGLTVWRLVCAVSLAGTTALFGASVGNSHADNTTLTAAQLTAFEQNATQHVIVLLKNQHTDLEGSALETERSAAIAADQSGIADELSALNAGNVHAFHIINAISAVVSPDEATRLRANPAVQAVMPDQVLAPPTKASQPGGASPAPSPTQTAPISSACSNDAAHPLPDESLTLTHDLDARTLKTPQGTPIDGRGVKVAFIADNIDPNNAEFIRQDGSHVITDYQDFNGDGTAAAGGAAEAFGDASSIAAQGNGVYDVAGYGTNPWPGGHCYINVQGMAPGASLLALKIIGSYPSYASMLVRAIDYAVQQNADVINESLAFLYFPSFSDNSVISQANSAAVADGVSVTVSSGDAGTQGTIGTPAANQDVMTVGGTTAERGEEQIGYPGSGPGDSSDTGRGTGWVSNNIAAFSSGGASDDGRRVVDFVAPGNSDWAACTPNTSQYTQCADLNNKPSPVILFLGTSESAPLTAGLAALVIQAYRSTHSGANPTPGEVKQLIKSTATNLNLPSTEQGSGLINASAAVQAALSLPDSQGSPGGTGDTFIYATNPGADPTATLSGQGYPGSPQTFPLTITNIGTHAETIQSQVLTLPQVTPTSYNLTLTPANSIAFHDGAGRPAHKIVQSFTVNSNQQYLNTALAWDTRDQSTDNPPGPNNTNAIVRETLYDPSGRIVGYSRPQNFNLGTSSSPLYLGSGFASFEVHDPQPGTWQSVIWEVDNATTYSGPVQFSVTQESFTSAGTVGLANLPTKSSSGSVTISPGKSQTFTIAVTSPTSPGVQDFNVLLQGSIGGVLHQQTVVPLVVQSFINPQPSGINPINGATVYSGSFSGTLTGGNGRPGGNPAQGYGFNVANGTRDIDLGITLPSNSEYNLQGALIDPAGNPVDLQSTIAAQDPNTFTPTAYTTTLQFFWRDPQPGIWRFILVINGTKATTGAPQTQEPFSGLLQFNSTRVTVTGVPNDAGQIVLPGGSVNATITVQNTGNETENYFADIRQANETIYQESVAPVGIPYPIPGGFGIVGLPGGAGGFTTPPASTQISVAAIGTNPFDMELQGANGQYPYGFTGIPDVLGDPGTDPIVGAYTNLATIQSGGDGSQTATEREVPTGGYLARLADQGPFQAAPNPGEALLQGQITTQTFDNSSCSSTGDAWALFITGQSQSCAPGGGYAPQVAKAGGSAQINVTLTAPTTVPGPNGVPIPVLPGTAVHGFIYVETLNIAVQTTTSTILSTGDGDEVLAIPYTYTIGP